MRPDLGKLFFIVSVLFLAFVFGAAAMLFKVFPYDQFNRALISYRALKELKDTAGADDKAWPPRNWKPGEDSWPTAVGHAASRGEELILVSGGREQLKSLCPENGCVAWLVDRQGRVRHVWRHDPDLWVEGGAVDREARDRIYPTGLHLYENGDLLVAYQAQNVFPIGVGIAKFDKDSNVIWKRADQNNHWFSVSDAGEIYVPAYRVVDSPLALGATWHPIECEQSKIALDAITVLSADGKLLREISLFDSLVSSGYEGVFRRNGCDPMHLNDLRVLGDAVPRYPPGIQKGDVLLSMRTLNAVALLDGRTGRIAWMSVGAAVAQHSPRYDGHEGVYVFDNRGGAAESGGSRVVRIPLGAGQPATVFPRPGVPVPGKFSSETAGHLDLHRDGKRLLVAPTHQGVAWEVDVTSGKVLWEYLNTHSLLGKHGRFPVYTAKYVYDTSFPFNQQEDAQ